MRHASPLPLILLLLTSLVGCGSKQPAGQSTPSPGTELLVRAALAKVLQTDAASIPMDRPISEPPLKADDLTLLDIILELENRAGIDISEDTIERYGGKLDDGPIKVTPNQIARMVEDSPKIGAAR